MNNSIPKITLLLLTLFLASSCANYNLHYSKEEKEWNDNIPPSEKPQHTVFLIGDCGKSPKDAVGPALHILEQKIKNAPKESTVIFLGDNIYPTGMPTKDDPKKRAQAEYQLDAQMRTLKEFKGKSVFIPGNHDWYDRGLEGLKRQEKYIQKKMNNGVEDKDEWEEYFLPDNGCSGPEVLEINDQLVILIIDSQWWLENWDRNPEINAGCDAKSRFAFNLAFEEALRKHRNKNVIIALHHPMESGGNHGGHFEAKQHIFPLTVVNKKAYIPLPVIGSISPLLRATVGLTQDISHPKYRGLKNTLIQAAKKNGNFIFASGHEHNLQYIQANRQHFVVSGSGTKTSAVKLIDGAEFAYAARGFAQIDFYENGAAWLSFYAEDKDHPDGREVFRKRIIDQLPIAVYEEPKTFPEFENMKDSVESHLITTPVKKKGFMHNILLGKHYRDVYIPTYKFPTLDLSEFQGGMVVKKRGGGYQTNSLRLEEKKSEREWVMRALTKDASRFIPYPFNKITGTQAIVEDNFLSNHPFAAIVLPDMADAVDVYHTNPRIYYIPKQPTLEEDNEAFGNELYLVEERPDDDWSNLKSFGNSKKIVSTSDVVEKVIKNGRHYVDQPWMLRSRLFDMVIGDWDRHDDQWRWASFEDKEAKRTYYRPVPRDRDQPFSKYDGMVAGIARLTLPFLKQLKPYSGDKTNKKWDNYGGRQIDQTFLTELEWKDWEKQVKRIQEGLTDEVIETAFKTHWPEPAYTLSGPEVMEKMKQRRDNLMNIAREYYNFRARAVDVLGSDKDDLFEVVRKNDNETEVSVYRLRKEGKTRTFHRTFYTDETKEIRLYGLDDDDIFKISGNTSRGILIRIIGGLGEEAFIDKSTGGGGSTIIYDTKDEEAKLETGPQTINKISNRRAFNIYNRKDFHYEYDFVMPFPLLGFNPDDGVFIGTNLTITDHKFKKAPYFASHNFKIAYAFATNALAVDYTGDYLEVFGRWDMWVKARVATPQYVDNFFGLGNETISLETEGLRDIDFYRVRRFNLLLNPNFKKRFAFDAGTFRFGPVLEGSKVEQTDDRFISIESGINSKVFDFQWFGGAEVALEFNNMDDQFMPRSGIRFHAGASWKTNLSDIDRSFTRYYTELTFYLSMNSKQSVIFASRVGIEDVGGQFEFFQAAVLDGNSNARGFRRDRFYGNTSFYHQNDIRIKLLSSRNNGLFPFSMGMTVGYDYGRVWLDGEKSNIWHQSYGGGLWIAPVDFIVINSTVYKSSEDLVIRVALGYSF